MPPGISTERLVLRANDRDGDADQDGIDAAYGGDSPLCGAHDSLFRSRRRIADP